MAPIQNMEKPFAKEADDVGVMLVSIVKAIKSKKPVAEIAAGELQHLINAIAGVDQVVAEGKENPEVMSATIGYHVGSIPGILLAPPKAE